MRVLIADKLPPEHVQTLRGIVEKVEYNPDLTEITLADHIPSVNVLVVRGTKVRSNVIDQADALEVIVRSGAGFENIDLEAASSRGIYVTNCPDKNSAAVAELTMGLLLAVDRRIPVQTSLLAAKKWDKATFGKADGLKGKVFGVIGTGAIGREVIKRAKALDMSVVAWSRSLTDEVAKTLGVTRAMNIDELIECSDIISLHVSLTPETKHLLSAERISQLKPKAIVLNTARGGLIDTDALAQALKEGRVRAGLDVYEDEPAEGTGTFDNILSGIPNWVGTHHIGASTDQAQRATADETVRIISTYAKTGSVENCVNFAKETPAEYELIIRHYDKIGVLTRILTDLREAKISVHEVHNVIFEGAKAAVVRIQLDTPPTEQTLSKIASRKDETIHIKLVRLQPVERTVEGSPSMVISSRTVCD
ncbi:MAG TPA: hydroxyacid dehydrogenase [Candidatus Acidoferrales bacterium]|nr:hydroxyacid dehydrogenase [Candidatus Acidoferrales bacterium]